MTSKDQMFTMSRSTTNKSRIICSSHIFDACVNRRLNFNKSISLHWIVVIWLATVFPALFQYHVHGLDELHIGGIFPVWNPFLFIFISFLINRPFYENNLNLFTLLLLTNVEFLLLLPNCFSEWKKMCEFHS